MTSAHPLVHHQARPLVGSVTAHVVSSHWATRVVSPLHDALSETERRAVLTSNPDSYLHVTSDPLALPEPPGDAAEPMQAKALRRLLELGAYTPVPEPALFVYRLTERGREHTGVIASVAVEGFGNGRVLGHEAVQPERVTGLVRHYERVPKRSELVALFHPVDLEVAELTTRVTAQPPILDFTDASGAVQSVWQAGQADAQKLAHVLGRQRLYIADGHHRVAAAMRGAEQQGRPGTVLCAVYPQHEIELHAFHRRVRGPVMASVLLERLATYFDVTAADGPLDASRVPPGAIGLYAAGVWRLLRPREHRRPSGVAGLDVTMLDQRVLLPVLGIDHGDPRLQFVPDLRDLAATLDECDADQGLLFTLHPPSIEDIISVAEGREVMSPKTTYVQPKPRTGIFLS